MIFMDGCTFALTSSHYTGTDYSHFSQEIACGVQYIPPR